MRLTILYSDSSLIVCVKPVGVPSESPGLPELVEERTGRKAWPVHRLDQGTGGVSVLAFSPEICASMQRLFQQSLVEKEYLAVVSGILPDRSGSWCDLLWHDRKNNKSYAVTRERSGVKKASCEWELLSSFSSAGQLLSLVRVRLHTGRTHQIRVQFGSRGFPLVGDRKYGSRIPADTVALWSSRLSFPHPDRKSGTVSVLSAPPPVYPWTLCPCDRL